MISLYIAQKSWLHRLSAGIKLLFLAAISLLLYPVEQPSVLLLFLIATLLAYATVGYAALRQLLALKTLLPLFALIFLLQWWSVGFAPAALLVMRMLTLILLANLITLTTRMDDMMDAVMPLFAPLRLLKIETRRIAFAVTLLIRFIPVLMAVVNHLLDAWKARGGGRKLWRLVIPLTIQSIRLSDSVAEALAARGGISSPLTQDQLHQKGSFR
ncbi:MAG: energy-coupling factor transporter transmembrane component T family protein [Nitrincola lacisaponensis]|uniref:Transmembrane component BioN of energizing module of biotin ECF transporter n=1 Tax=Nitrincola lacisaponensis TaxID=267850 RepID=A0A063Y4M4_9GAMM|nr:energy-coupling factor transporter transmembrane protein EcfT [Nitrincola lacisaponensis]KDE40624.1 Transmembrane component BioN of energizing module of biotin ECF transporter [Nitrincola lacisaponensis]